MRSSVYDRRTTDGWRDRLRRLTGREDGVGGELILSKDGSPTLVTAHGEVIGFRRRDGGIERIPERPRRLEDPLL